MYYMNQNIHNPCINSFVSENLFNSNISLMSANHSSITDDKIFKQNFQKSNNFNTDHNFSNSQNLYTSSKNSFPLAELKQNEQNSKSRNLIVSKNLKIQILKWRI